MLTTMPPCWPLKTLEIQKKGPVIFLLLVKHMELHSSLQQEHLLKYCLCRRVSTGKFYQVILVKSQQISQAAFSLSRSFQPYS